MKKLLIDIDFYGIVSVLNNEITQILNDDKEQEEQEGETLDTEPKAEAKKGFFARLFSRGVNEKDAVKQEKRTRNAKMIFADYRNTIREFQDSYSSFLLIDLDGPTVIDRQILTIILTNIKNINAIQKRNYLDFTEDDRIYLEGVQPHDLWTEIAKYYSATSELSTFVQNFGKNIDKIERMYKDNPEYFDIENLRRIFQENDEVVVDLKMKNKAASVKSSEYIKKKQDEKEKRAKLRELDAKKSDIRARSKRVRNAKSLKELGYKNKEDAARKLGIETKDYIIVPIPSTISNFDKLFADEKRLKVEVDGQTFFASYINDVVTGRINTISEEKDVNSALMIPIKSLKKEDIDAIKSGKVCVNKSVLLRDDVFLFMPEGGQFDVGDTGVKTQGYSYGKLATQIEKFLGDDFTLEQDETENYDIFKGIKNISTKEKRLRKDSVIKCLSESLRRNIVSTDEIRVNGKTFFISKDDEKDIIQSEKKILPLDESLLMSVTEDIENYLIEDGNNRLKVDLMYKKLLEEYMRVNKKVKAEYYEEEDATVSINDRKISIKPILPAKDETIARRYSRSKEDIVYKTMKLAALVNRFAHLTENQELQDMLFEAKLDLIENAIDMSKGNPNVTIRKNFDSNKMALSVVAEIPGYNMIALHTINKSNSLTRKANSLEEYTGEILQTSTLQIPGVNKELLSEMRKLPEEERAKFLLGLDSTVFSKFAMRMGYTSEQIKTEEDKKKFIKKMTSDRKIDELLKESEELEK